MSEQPQTQPQPKTPRRAPWFAAVAAIAVIAGVTWFARHRTPETETTDATADAVPATASSHVASGINPLRAAPPAPAVTAKRVDDAACVIKAPAAPRIAGDASGGAFAEVDAPAAPNAATLAARERILARLRASTDPYANAVAVWLVVPDAHDDPDGRLAAEREARLAALAVHTRDPRIYALALRSCWGRSSQACLSLSARQWAVLDPDNAMPWAMMLDEAAKRQDVSGAQEALFHISHSARFDDGGFVPLQPVIDAAEDDDVDLVGAHSLAADAIGLAAGQVWPHSITACRYATPADANVWQQCTAMADLLENHADSLMLRLAGASVDKQLTGNAEPGRRLVEDLKRSAALGLDSSTGCADLRGKLAFLRREATMGEADALAAQR